MTEYRCDRCRTVFSLKAGEALRCPECEGRLLFKVRPRLVRKVRAR